MPSGSVSGCFSQCMVYAPFHLKSTHLDNTVIKPCAISSRYHKESKLQP
jgi:hypothetical protein